MELTVVLFYSLHIRVDTTEARFQTDYLTSHHRHAGCTRLPTAQSTSDSWRPPGSAVAAAYSPTSDTSSMTYFAVRSALGWQLCFRNLGWAWVVVAMVWRRRAAGMGFRWAVSVQADGVEWGC